MYYVLCNVWAEALKAKTEGEGEGEADLPCHLFLGDDAIFDVANI